MGEPGPFIPATKMVPHELEAVPGYRRLAWLGRGGSRSICWFHVVSIVMEVPNSCMLRYGKSQTKIDDDWGTSVLGNLHMNPVPLFFLS